MRIPTHQIHNVLNAYIRQLKARHGTGHDGGPPENQPADRSLFWSGFTERRWIMDKISADIIRRILRSGARPQGAGTESAPRQSPSQPPAADIFHYHILTPAGEKIRETIKLQDTDFLLRQIEETARKGRE